MPEEDDIFAGLNRDYLPKSSLENNLHSNINLDKQPNIYEYHSPPSSPSSNQYKNNIYAQQQPSHDFANSPKSFDLTLEENVFDNNVQTTRTKSTPKSPRDTNQSDTTIFHVVSIICALISLVTLIPLFELIPACVSVFIRYNLRSPDKNNKVLHCLDFAITMFVFIIFICIIIVIAVFTYGIGLILLILLIPFGFVLFALIVFWPRTLPNQDLL